MTIGSESPSPAAATRSAIVEASVALFAAHGYVGASINDIAERVGCTKGAIYHYFPRKADLLLEIHDRCLNVLIAGIEKRALAELTPEEEVSQIVWDVMLVIHDFPEHVQVFFNEWRHLEEDDLATAKLRRDQYAHHLTKVIRRGAETGVFAVGDPEVHSYFAFGVVNWAYQWYSPAGDSPYQDVAERMTTFILRGLGGGDHG